jgi:FkbM family methyltransferase
MTRFASPDGYVPPPAAVRVLASLYLTIFGRKALYRWNQFLLGVAARGICVSDPMLRDIGPAEQAFLRRIARIANPTVFDVGANVGAYSGRLKQLCPSARIWAFEPHPATYRQLAAVAAASGFMAVNVGLSDHSGRVELYDYRDIAEGAGSPHASLHREVIEQVHHAQAVAIDVEVKSISQVMKSENVQHLSLLKIDAEGHELPILKGAAEAIAAGRVDVVQFEFNEMNVMSRVFFRDFYDALPGFSFYRMVVNGLAPMGDYRPRTHELFFLHNVVAVRDGVDYLTSLL